MRRQAAVARRQAGVVTDVLRAAMERSLSRMKMDGTYVMKKLPRTGGLDLHVSAPFHSDGPCPSPVLCGCGGRTAGKATTLSQSSPAKLPKARVRDPEKEK